MTAAELARLQEVHGGLAWVSVAALSAACVLIWRGRGAGRGAPGAWAAGIAAVLGVAVFVTGAMLHGPFQGRLRQRLFLASETLGWLFERKEHAAFGALALTLSALFAIVAARTAPRRPAGSEGASAARTLRRAALVGLSAALVLSLLSLAVSLAAARRASF